MSALQPYAPPAQIRIMAVDDHALMRSGIIAVINAEPDMTVVAEASTGLDALALYRQHRPDVTLMDLRLRDMDGVASLATIRREFPEARVVILTTFAGDFQAARAMKAGAAGYLLKDMLRTDLVEIVRGVHAGKPMFPPEILASMEENASSRELSFREAQVLRHVAQGQANREIAVLLGLTEDTIKVHMRTILSKLAAKDRTHAVTIAVKRGIIEL